MATPNDGGPAFPRPYSEKPYDTSDTAWRRDAQEGMSLRDFHAAAALQGCVQGTFMASIILRMIGEELQPDAIPSEAEVVAAAYRYADAMIAEAITKEQT